MSAKRLPCRERLKANQALVDLTAGGARGDHGGRWRPGREAVITAAACDGWERFPVTGHVAAEGLVGRESLPADGTGVLKLLRRLQRGGSSGGGGVTGEHEEAEGEVLFFGRGAVEEAGVPLGSLPLGPALDMEDVGFVGACRRRRRSWGRRRLSCFDGIYGH
ncbi:hypothetical protein M5K25_019654 [Dendrobium thyrsiflorum]|uniref:Uncharacterized protein n=1 Tax=Dendrobium thyrsiflorum TaxID=117978 RepID=A0ABD0UFZ0_DENTH